MLALCTLQFDLDLSNARQAFPSDDHKQRLYEYTLDPATGKADMRLFADVTGDFPVVPASVVGACDCACVVQWLLLLMHAYIRAYVHRGCCSA